VSAKSKNSILIIDDDPDVREIVHITLSRKGFSVELAENGKEGLAVAKATKPDLIILDILMPEKDGISTFEEMMQDEDLQSVPVVFLTSVSDRLGIGISSDVLETSLGKKPDGFLEKPVDGEELIRTVTKLLS
jgi:two-component system alkaline phosphatase synthesis response regulator PhoP